MEYTLMNVAMTKAILDGSKIQTRRIVKFPRDFLDGKSNISIEKRIQNNRINFRFKYDFTWEEGTSKNLVHDGIKPKYQKDEIIWVREPAKVIFHEYSSNRTKRVDVAYRYSADAKMGRVQLPDRFYDENMCVPKWVHKKQGIPNGCIVEMARIFLKITDVRVERLQYISDEDILSEGVKNRSYEHSAFKEEDNRNDWIDLWNSTAPKGYKWEDNPYIFVYEFKRVNKDGSDYEQHSK